MTQKNKTIVNAMLIVAAGTGERAKTKDNLAKQYKNLQGKPIVLHSVEIACFCEKIDIVQVVIHKNHEKLYQKSVIANEKLLNFCFGGATRQESVWLGLQALLAHRPKNVLIHDAARPFVSEKLIDSVILALGKHQAVLPFLPVENALKKIDKNSKIIKNVNRKNYILAQTPQGFDFGKIYDAHKKAAKEKIHNMHDDVELAILHEIDVFTIAGEKNNIKLTTTEDFGEDFNDLP